jgi:CxxC motif-containing protein (DUF1111 family)
MLASACSSASSTDDPLDGIKLVGDDPVDTPLLAATPVEVERFNVGDALFEAVFREPDGIGPLYVRNACGACHAGAGRGPGAVDKMALVDADGITPLADQSGLKYGHTVRPYRAAGAMTPIAPPISGAMVKVSQRLGPALFGRGYLEAIADAEILRMQAEQKGRDDGIHGRPNRVVYHSQANPETAYHAHHEGEADLIGRFGFKARVATLDDFTADAFQGDMGITSPLRPVEPPNPDGLTDDGQPGVDVTANNVNAIADYMRLIEIPGRFVPPGPGKDLFAAARCSVCHAPTLKTRADYPIKALAGIAAPVYTDLLLHDLGDALADGLTDESATSRSWKTAPLIGVRHQTSFLHDGRATTVEQAILAHGGPGSEANDSVSRFKSLALEKRKTLIDFVQSL